MEVVTIIGAGAMGRQIALQCALYGIKVALTDQSEDSLSNAAEFYKIYLAERVKKGRLLESALPAIFDRISFHPELKAALSGSTLVIEAIIEKFDAKAELFKEIENYVSIDTILASNSSNITASRLAKVCKIPGRVMNIHFFNPALVMKLVEIVRHEGVEQIYIDRAKTFCKAIEKHSVLLNREVPGFIVNRIFRALTKEAISLYENGYASAEDIDSAVTLGLGHPMGPLRLIDSTGIDVSYLARQDEYIETGNEDAKPNEILKKMFEDGRWGKKTGQGFYEYHTENKSE